MRRVRGSLRNRVEPGGSGQLRFSLQRYNEDAVRIELDISIPEASLDENAKNRLRRDALEAAILRLFDERRVSSAEAAEELGLTRIQFMELTRRRGIPHHDYTAEDLADDLSDLKKIEDQLPPSGSLR
jgi:predicted HTH domain antitoxin